ncbi:hypothetical protein LTR35_005247 [Friedmanniomyces endolithicus]|uniref:Uncharacterized protein n=1 Tax=Friedmanniomyces endolithicus TaxID=329885 RepID=A0AAN6JED4_9PEZI|nr:hypothetical protein LTR35_005247 [Friedmanniomyces endolithicus]KAK0299549.1 hypothetical protein LTS00_001994 [Friedmanniomyces endolithicus]KAK0327042.1 hypothetical protein LTR82_001804 [Friedmanniomyces endolithicus]KAK1019123.1 hypothetical protein LTR54_000936 [Friedmanniomyces endolithicus]
MATPKLRTPTLAFATLSIGLNLAIIGCAAHTLHVFNAEQSSNVWLLPLWPNHFDTRELHALLGTATAIVVLNAVLILPLFVRALPAPTFIALASALLSTVCSLIAVVFPALLNTHAPRRDTLQTWTCRWSSTAFDSGAGRAGSGPTGFGTLCHETRFAFYTTIPVFLLQLLLLGAAVYTLVLGRRLLSQPKGSIFSGKEKVSGSQVELGQVGGRGQSFETSKTKGSPRSQMEELMEEGGEKKAVQFA